MRNIIRYHFSCLSQTWQLYLTVGSVKPPSQPAPEQTQRTNSPPILTRHAEQLISHEQDFSSTHENIVVPTFSPSSGM
jgi:hypothetical protein